MAGIRGLPTCECHSTLLVTSASGFSEGTACAVPPTIQSAPGHHGQRNDPKRCCSPPTTTRRNREDTHAVPDQRACE
jgi:hypothetical protein